MVTFIVILTVTLQPLLVIFYEIFHRFYVETLKNKLVAKSENNMEDIFQKPIDLAEYK